MVPLSSSNVEGEGLLEGPLLAELQGSKGTSMRGSVILIVIIIGQLLSIISHRSKG
jgi:hypothetical protein